MASGRWYHVLTERLALFAVLTLLCASCIAYNLDSLLQRVYANQRARSAAKIRYTAEPVAPIRWASTPPPPPPDPYSVYAADVSDVLHSDWQLMKKGSIRHEECLELKQCRYRCDWKDDNAINPCFSGCLCPTPDCMVLPNLPLPPSPPGPLNRTNAGPVLLPTSKPAPFMCVRNPFYARTNVSGRQGLTCLGERTGDPLPNAPLPNSSLPQHDIDVIHFKRQTATWFDNWVDWVVGPCARRPKSDVNASSMSYTYDPVLHNYTLRNVCFRSNGRIAAYQPTPVKVYVDGHFRFWGGGEKQQYFTDIEALPQPPTCFRRQKVFLSYFVMPIYNSFFTTIKAASELKFLNALWPHAKDDVLHLRLISPHCEDFEKRGLPNTYNFFRGALSRFGWATLRQKPKPGQDAMVCFEEVSMLHTCESEMCEGPAQSGELGRTQKWKVTMEGLRNEEEERLAVHGLRDAMGLCTGVTRTVVNKTHPRLIIVDRHHGKRYANLNMVMAGIADYAFAKGFHTLHVVDQRHGIEPISLVRLHQRADVLFGHCGGGMSWLFTQPRGSVVLETVVGSCAEQYYAQWDSARVCDYGGLSMNSNVSYYTAFVSKRSRLAYDDLNIPLAYWERLIDLAHCKLLSNPDGVASTNQSACGTPTIQAWESLLSPGNPRELMLGD